LKKLNVIILALVLTVTMGLTVYAETGAGNTGGTNTPGTMNGNTTGGTGADLSGNRMPGDTGINNNMYRTTQVDNDSDWEWVGLLGLIGLAGLMGRNRERNRTPQK